MGSGRVDSYVANNGYLGLGKIADCSPGEVLGVEPSDNVWHCAPDQVLDEASVGAYVADNLDALEDQVDERLAERRSQGAARPVLRGRGHSGGF